MADKIQSLHAKRFKTINDAIMDVGNINVFIGANNSGKSTIAQLLHFAVGVFQTIELADRWANKDTVGLSLAPHELLYTPCSDLYALGHKASLKEASESGIEFGITLNSGSQIKLSIRRGRNGNIRVEVEGAQSARLLANVQQPFTIYSPGLAGIAKHENFISTGVLLRTIARGDANLVLRNILCRLYDDEKKWRAFLGDLTDLFTTIDISIHYNEATDENILVETDLGSGSVPIELAGTGVLQAVQILGYIHYFNPSTIILDEPDSHLHPNNQRLLCSLLQQISDERDTQVFLTTHSRHVVDALSGQAQFLWVREGTIVPVGQDHDLAVLLDIGALDASELISNSHANCIVLTEDSRRRPLETVLSSSGFLMNECLILSYHGCTSPHSLRPLVDLIRATNPNAKIVVHRDRDYLTNAEVGAWEVEIRRLSCEPFATAEVDIESYFLNADHLGLLNDLSSQDASELIEQATSDCRILSIEKYVNGRVDIAKKSGNFGSLDHGSLATEAPHQIDGFPERFRHGKSVLKKIRALYQEKFNSNLLVFRPSLYLHVEQLATMFRKIV